MNLFRIQTVAYLVLIILLLSVGHNCFSAAEIALTKTEQQWLKQHPRIRIAHEKHYPPFEWQDEKGDYLGISVDYIKLIAKRLNINFETIENNSWEDILTKFKAGQIDVLPLLARNKQREQFMLFTHKHVSVPNVIISSSISPEQSKGKDLIALLRGKKIAVVAGFYWDDFLTEYEDQIRIVRVNDTRTAIELTAMGGVDGMISDMGSVTYIIREDHINNLKIVKTLPQQIKMGMGIRKDWGVFQSILNKALDSITDKERDNIQSRWIHLEELPLWRQPVLWYSVIAVALFFSILLGIIIAWNTSLKRQVERRSREISQMQIQLMHAEKMESIGRLSAGIAHEVKNPLAIMQMGIDFLRAENLKDVSKEILQNMTDAVDRADGVIKGLLDFSHDEELILKPGDINQVIRDSIHLIQHELRLHHIRLDLKLDQHLPNILMDANKLQQVFINLFMNAIQAMGQQGNLEIMSNSSQLNDPRVIHSRERTFRQNQQVILIIINDTGSGLPDDKAEAVFEPFFTTKPVGEGTGLGLSVSRSIVKLHQGAIYMQNRNPQGVEVKIIFPLI